MERIAELQTVAGTTAAMAAADDLEAALRALLCGMADLTGARSGGVRLLNDPRHTLGACRLYFWRQPDRYCWVSVENWAGSNTVRALASEYGIYFADIASPPTAEEVAIAEALGVPRPGSSLIVPLRAGQQRIGTLHADAEQPHAFREEQLVPLCVLADHAAGAVRQAQLREDAALGLRLLETALQASGTSVFTYALGGRLTRVQGAAESVVGWRPEEMVGRHVLDFIHQSDHARVSERLAARERGDGAVFQYEARLLHRDGHPVAGLLTVGPHVVGGRIVGGAGAVVEQTPVKQLQAERDAALAARARAEGAVRTGRSVVHELASPLGAVLGIAELLALDPRLPPDMLRDMQTLQEQIARIGQLLQRFGRIARYEEAPSPAGPQLDLQRASGTPDQP